MVDVKIFLDYLCNELDYRFFAGVPCKGLSVVYKKLDSNILHYIPATSEAVAVSIVNGVSITGIKSVAIIHASMVNKINLDFNLTTGFPLFIIAYTEDNIKFNKGIYSLELGKDFRGDLDKIDKYLISKKGIGVLIIKEGVLR